MVSGTSWTLSEVARILREPQHRLIHLCEQGAVRPAVEQARGRGSSRRFSRRNMLEFVVALKLRELMVPVSVVGAVIHVLGATEKALARELPGFVLPDSLIESGAPELRVIITDGPRLFFALHAKGQAPRLLGGIKLTGKRARTSQRAKSGTETDQPAATFGPGSDDERGRVEVSVTRLAKDLSRSLASA
jgi:hypothetical protein